ncbi:helix-turn-helix domain-containing protein [Xylanimonas ulmi]|uniref:AraC-like DNA-binding protein n=1 Tax=Xylanimonas ulmi TaxID=228973 RepID=A0A4Q7M5Y1_9MICO|nr:AraC family transcriptional regulator [Xylanibacterium ulmi]RZS62417.1 AraC-like DNA-binding protein [Xylanibacterium ulmi]
MTLSTPMARPMSRRSALAAPAPRTHRPTRLTTGCPFEPEPGAAVSVREWKGDEDLAQLGSLVPVTARPESFHLQTRTARFGSFDVTYMVHGPLRFEPAADNFGHDVKTLRMVVVLDGEVVLRTGDALHGEQATLRRRDGALVLGWAPVSYTAAAPARVVVVDVPVDHDALVGLPETAPFVVGGSETALLSALAAFALDLLRQDVETLTPAVRAQVTDSLESLYSGTVSTLAVPSGGDWNRRSQRMHVVRYIATHYADPQLGPTTLAAHLGMSKRSLQRLFEGEKMSVSQLVQAKRVDQVLLRLRDPRYAGTSLDELAVLTGFGSALALRRAVQAATGRTPSALRQEALTGWTA